MATARDIVTRALRRAKIVAYGETPDDEQIVEGLESLNDLVEAWLDESVQLGLRELTLSSPMTVDRAVRRVIIDNLAIELADDAGIAVSQVLATRAERGKAGLVGRFFGSPDAKVDIALTRGTRFSIERG